MEINSESMLSTPLITTIIPAFNAELWLAEAINSALLQNVDQEILVINDGSNDRTAQIAAAYPPPVRLIHKINGGVSSARNTGLKEAKGEFIAFLDADDVWLPGKIEKQLAAFKEFPSAGTIICDEAHVNDKATIIRKSFFASKSFADELPKITDIVLKPLTWLATESFFPTSGVLTRKSCVLQAGMFDESFSIVEDRDYWIRLALIAPIVIIPEILLNYRVANPFGLSITGQKSWANNLLTVLIRYQRELERSIAQEGGNLRDSIGSSFETIAETMWNNGNYREAGKAYGLAKMYGKHKPLKQIAATMGLAEIAVRIKEWHQKNRN